MIGSLGSLAVGTALSAGSSLLNSRNAKKSAKQGAYAADQASRQQVAGLEQGLTESGKLYDTSRADISQGGSNALGYLQPYMDRGDEGANLLRQIIGLDGEDAQAEALGMYETSPAARLLQKVRDETVRRTQGEFASGGMLRSGAMTESLGRRLSDQDLGAYYNWQGLGEGLANQGYQAASQASGIAQNTGTNLANLAQARGNNVLNARTNQGTARASGTIGAVNARLAGNQASSNALSNFLGKASQTDFSGAFGKGGGDVGLGSWKPTIKFG